MVLWVWCITFLAGDEDSNPATSNANNQCLAGLSGSFFTTAANEVRMYIIIMYVCMYVCMYVRMYVCMYVCR